MPNLLPEPQPIAVASRSDDCRGWNDGIQRPDDISFQITEVLEPGRNAYQDSRTAKARPEYSSRPG